MSKCDTRLPDNVVRHKKSDIRLIALALCAGLLIAGVWFATTGDTDYNQTET